MKENLNLDKALVIGGAGAIGSNLSNYLVNEGFDVLVIDNLSSGNMNSLLEGVRFKYCDIRDRDKIRKAILEYNPNYIFNMAAHFANQNSVDFPYEDIGTNVIGQVNVLEACKDLKSLNKYVYASSSCVYGHLDEMKENVAIYPYETPYAINKFCAELYTKYYAELFSVSTVSVRIFNTFGEGELAGEYRNVIPNFVECALKNEDIYITGTGEETRDFTYVLDTVNCLVLAAKSKFKNGEVFNSGTGTETKIKYLADSIIKISNSKSKVVFKERRNWDVVSTRVSDLTNSNELLNYVPQYSLLEGLNRTINWYKSNMR